MQSSAEVLLAAYQTRSIREFTELLFPSEWGGVRARILESGAWMSPEPCAWAPRWSAIPPTVRRGASEVETALKSCIFRVHDCLHQLWGLPLPDADFNEESRYAYKRVQMCGEVVVLALTELEFCSVLLRRWPELKLALWKRNALPLLEGPLAGKGRQALVLRLDELLHKHQRQQWVRQSSEATAFADDYIPMLERDRCEIDYNWSLMRAANWRPEGAPLLRFDSRLTGLETTLWMVRDFEQLLATSPHVDQALRGFNRARRARILLPAGWGRLPE